VDNRIIAIELLPAWNAPQVQSRLKHSLDTAQLLRCAVAYWTVESNFLGPALPAKLSRPNGYLCVDYHLPTDIDELAALVTNGANVRIYCEDISTALENERRSRPLLHTKMLLFWMADRTAELWVGSHNWTKRALLGLNVESSLVVKLSDSSSLFCEAVQYLEEIKGICEVFDPSRVELYKQLQGWAEQTVRSIELEALDADALGEHQSRYSERTQAS
jgi:PLD-like domain